MRERKQQADEQQQQREPRPAVPLGRRAPDAIVLGCTHYPFLRPLIAEIVGPDVTLIDTGAAVARQLRRVLEARNLLAPATSPGTECFWTTGDLETARRVMATLWGRAVEVQPVPEPYC